MDTAAATATDDELAAQYLPYALWVAQRAAGRRWWLQDEASAVAMLALVEAIRKRGRWHDNFGKFVALVVKRRVGDQAKLNRARFWERSCQLWGDHEAAVVDEYRDDEEDLERLVRLAPVRCHDVLRAVYGRRETLDGIAVRTGCSRAWVFALLCEARAAIRLALA